MKNAFDDLSNRLDMDEERISETEIMTIGTSKSTKKNKRLGENKAKQNTQEL